MRTTITRSLSFALAIAGVFFGFAVSMVSAQGGLDRMAPDTRAVFEDGNYFEVSWAAVSPRLQGTGGAFDPLELGTGNILESYDQWGFALKSDLTQNISFALILDQPWGVNTNYPQVATSGYSGTLANLESNELSAILKAKMTNRVSAYGGLRYQSIEARAAFPFGGAIGLPGPYRIDAGRDEGLGFMAGAAYEIEKIKLRAALTYYSEIDSSHETTEVAGATTVNGVTDISTPQSINLELQSGIAKDTLAFGSIRWVDWSKFAISPPLFSGGLGIPLVDYTEDWTTYTIGIGRKVTERFSIAFIFRYTPMTGQQLTTLGPVDGRNAYTIAPSYQFNRMKITTGISYIDLGAATNFAATNFDDGRAFAVGTRIGFNF